MKKITVTLSDKAEKYFNDIMYSLPRHADGSGMCTQSQAINYALVSLQAAEKKWENESDPTVLEGEKMGNGNDECDATEIDIY